MDASSDALSAVAFVDVIAVDTVAVDASECKSDFSLIRDTNFLTSKVMALSTFWCCCCCTM